MLTYRSVDYKFGFLVIQINPFSFNILDNQMVYGYFCIFDSNGCSKSITNKECFCDKLNYYTEIMEGSMSISHSWK